MYRHLVIIPEMSATIITIDFPGTGGPKQDFKITLHASARFASPGCSLDFSGNGKANLTIAPDGSSAAYHTEPDAGAGPPNAKIDLLVEPDPLTTETAADLDFPGLSVPVTISDRTGRILWDSATNPRPTTFKIYFA